jgi:hypothetical protein
VPSQIELDLRPLLARRRAWIDPDHGATACPRVGSRPATLRLVPSQIELELRPLLARRRAWIDPDRGPTACPRFG